jgi:hypothetical protein
MPAGTFRRVPSTGGESVHLLGWRISAKIRVTASVCTLLPPYLRLLI